MTGNLCIRLEFREWWVCLPPRPEYVLALSRYVGREFSCYEVFRGVLDHEVPDWESECLSCRMPALLKGCW